MILLFLSAVLGAGGRPMTADPDRQEQLGRLLSAQQLHHGIADPMVSVLGSDHYEPENQL
jgi:hypothetical protein